MSPIQDPIAWWQFATKTVYKYYSIFFFFISKFVPSFFVILLEMMSLVRAANGVGHKLNKMLSLESNILSSMRCMSP